jgi:hypothetical protein
MFASRSAPVRFLVLRVTLETVKTTVAILPVFSLQFSVINFCKFINEMMNEVKKAAEMSVQYVIRD